MDIYPIIKPLLIYILFSYSKNTVYSTLENEGSIESKGFTPTKTDQSSYESANKNHPKEIKIITKDPSDFSKTKENDDSQYDLRNDYVSVDFTFKENSKCIEVKYENESVWKVGSEQIFPDLVRFIPLNGIFVYFEQNYLSYEKDLNGKWYFVGKKGNPPQQSTGYSVKLYPRDYPEKLKIITQNRHYPNNIEENDTTQYKVYKKLNDLEYYFEKNAKCLQVNYDDKLVWKNDKDKHTEYPRILYFIPDTKSILLSFKDNSFYVHRFENNEWRNFFDGKLNPIQFGINYKKSDKFIDYSKDDTTNTHTYTPKENFVFGGIKESKKYIFEVKDRTEYATKAIVIFLKSSDINLAVHMLSGHIKKLEKRNGIWNEVTEFTKPELEPEEEKDETEGVEGEEYETENLTPAEPTLESDDDKPTEFYKPMDDEPEEDESPGVIGNIEFTFVRKFDIKYLYYIIPAVLGIFLLIALIIYK